MKKLNEISWNVSEPEYRADRALSYSTIARYQKEGFAGLHKLFDKVETPSLLFGSIVDTLLTEPKEFDKLFYVADVKELQPELDATVRSLHTKHGKDVKNLYMLDDETISEVAMACGYWQSTRYKAATRAKNVRENGAELYTTLSICGDKTIVSRDMYYDASLCVAALQNNPDTVEYFGASSHLDRYYQLKFKGSYEGIPVRCMFDFIGVDHEKKIIYPGDLKTTSEMEFNFPKSFLKWKYYIQSNLYTYILKEVISKDEYFKGFTIAKWALIVINRNNKTPMVWIDDTNHSVKDYEVGGKVLGENWRKTLPELVEYLKMPEIPLYPLWKKSKNSIREYLEEIYGGESKQEG